MSGLAYIPMLVLIFTSGIFAGAIFILVQHRRFRIMMLQFNHAMDDYYSKGAEKEITALQEKNRIQEASIRRYRKAITSLTARSLAFETALSKLNEEHKARFEKLLKVLLEKGINLSAEELKNITT